MIKYQVDDTDSTTNYEELQELINEEELLRSDCNLAKDSTAPDFNCKKYLLEMRPKHFESWMSLSESFRKIKYNFYEFEWFFSNKTKMFGNLNISSLVKFIKNLA